MHLLDNKVYFVTAGQCVALCERRTCDPVARLASPTSKEHIIYVSSDTQYRGIGGKRPFVDAFQPLITAKVSSKPHDKDKTDMRRFRELLSKDSDEIGAYRRTHSRMSSFRYLAHLMCSLLLSRFDCGPDVR
jgi:hypothetical protein